MALEFGTIAQTVFLDASPLEVYEALLDPRKHSEFTGSPATTSAKVGARSSKQGTATSGGRT